MYSTEDTTPFPIEGCKMYPRQHRTGEEEPTKTNYSFLCLAIKEMVIAISTTHFLTLEVKGSTLRPLFFGLSISEWFLFQ